jgi:hypothetical protein
MNTLMTLFLLLQTAVSSFPQTMRRERDFIDEFASHLVSIMRNLPEDECWRLQNLMTSQAYEALQNAHARQRSTNPQSSSGGVPPTTSPIVQAGNTATCVTQQYEEQIPAAAPENVQSSDPSSVNIVDFLQNFADNI